jgi:uncharacterized protein YbjT (DUF2867 family)
MKVLAVGATGPNAGLVVPELVKRGVEVRAMVRAEGKADAARQRGVTEIAIGDLRDPGSLRAAVEEVEGVFHINPAFAPDEAGMGEAMVQAAAAAGVRKFVFSSVYHPSLSLTNHAGKRPVEEALYGSGMDFTVLQPAMFMQTLGGIWPSVLEQGQIAMPYAKLAKVCYVDYRDVAEVAAAAMTGTDLSYGTFELCAPGMVTRTDIAQMMSDAAGRRIEAAEVDFDQWADAAKIPDGPMRDGFKRMYAEYDQHGFAGGNALILRSILGREPRTLRAYIEELASR